MNLKLENICNRFNLFNENIPCVQYVLTDLLGADHNKINKINIVLLLFFIFLFEIQLLNKETEF